MERYNLVVIGAGSGGLVVAAGGSGLGARVALAEKHALPFTPEGGEPVRAMGGDCLQYGCVPVEGAPPRREGRARRARGGPLRDPRRLRPGPAGPRRRHGLRARARRPTSPRPTPSSASTGLGVDVLLGAGTLKSAHEVEVNGTTVWGRHVVVATGSRREHPGDSRPRGDRLPHERIGLRPRTLPEQLPRDGRRADRHRDRPGVRAPRLEGHDRVVHAAHLPEGGRRRRGGPRGGG